MNLTWLQDSPRFQKIRIVKNVRILKRFLLKDGITEFPAEFFLNLQNIPLRKF
jgi:hypothetical protein